MKVEGILWKWTNYWSGWQTRWFVLDNGVLSYYNSEEEVNQGCKGSMKVSALEINVSPVDGTRMDLVISGEQHIYLRCASPAERQKWLVALGSAKACVSTHNRSDSAEPNPDILKLKKSELRLYCDLLMQQVHTVKTEATREEGPDLQKLDEAKDLLGATCDTFIKTLEECIRVTNASLGAGVGTPFLADSNAPAFSHLHHHPSKPKTSKSSAHIVRSTSIDKKM